jgi:hypothetical protein
MPMWTDLSEQATTWTSLTTVRVGVPYDGVLAYDSVLPYDGTHTYDEANRPYQLPWSGVSDPVTVWT